MRQFVRPEQMPKINEIVAEANRQWDNVGEPPWFLDPPDDGLELTKYCDDLQAKLQAVIAALRNVRFAIQDAWHENYPAATPPKASPTTDDLMV